eukprot:9185304-Karenia_brevis.AAC.1
MLGIASRPVRIAGRPADDRTPSRRRAIPSRRRVGCYLPDLVVQMEFMVHGNPIFFRITVTDYT